MSNGALDYQIVRKLADGGAAEVFLARGADGQPVSLKILRPELTTDANVVGRFLDESRVCQQLDHPNVIRHVAAGKTEDGRVYLVTEHLEGEDLASHLKTKGPLTVEQLVKLAVPLCDALAYVHDRGVVHRDLKPDNLFLRGGLTAFDPKLLDFGLANFHGKKSVRTSTGVILATPEYTPPECINGKKADVRSDVYALGVLLYEALTGSPPFVATNYGELLIKHLKEAPPPLTGPAASLNSVLQRCLAKEPSQRFGSAKEVAAALEQAATLQSGGEETLDRTFMPSKSSAGAPVEIKHTPMVHEGQGQVLGPYKIVRVLGEGAMGQVFLARHSKLGRQVAVKMLKPEHARNTELIQRFFQEARTVNEINHEHIVEIFDFVEETDASNNPRVYCVMELLAGKSLTDLMRSQPLPPRRIVGIVRQMCGALAAAHKVGVVHRDIKPDNVFVTERSGIVDFVKVLDFGVAKLSVQLGDAPRVGTMDGAIIGTPAYMAPEQASGKPVDFRADVYAVGVVLYELLTGRVPFDGESFGQLVVQILTQAPPPIPDATASGEPIPATLKALALRCMAKEPDQRPPSMVAVEQELAAIAKGTAVVPTADELAALSGPVKPRRKKGPLLAAAGGGLALVAAVAFVALRPPPATPLAPVAAPVQPASPSTVSLAVASTPSGAKVFRSDTGQELGRTPLALGLPYTDREVGLRFELDGYEPTTRPVRLSKDVSLEVVLPQVARARAETPAEVARPVRTGARPKKQTAKKHEKVSDDAIIDPFAM